MAVLFTVSARSINIFVATLSGCQTADLSETLLEDIKGEKSHGRGWWHWKQASLSVFLLLASSEICGPASQGYITWSRPSMRYQVCNAKKEEDAAAGEGCGNHPEPTPGEPAFAQRQTAGVAKSDGRGCERVCVPSSQRSSDLLGWPLSSSQGRFLWMN